MSDILYAVDGPVATITLNRPQARNAYSAELIGGLVGSLAAAERDDDVRAVIITGAGPAFCAGGDLKAMQEKTGMFEGDPAELRDNYRLGIQSITRRFDSFEKPVVAAINGPAIGAGLGLASMCDIRVAAEDARFGASFTRVGLIPGDGSGYLLARAIGFSRALELVLTSRIFDAEEAHWIGFVHHVVEPDQVVPEAQDIATRLAHLPQQALRLTKVSMYRSWSGDTETAMQLAAAFQSLAQNTDEHLEAVEAMLERLS
jgi:enoyl-CoA hydratase/carnithine racemase